ncbi:hypothetical protein BH11PSE5_BH11PSE5_04810 [soil metagenome]
MLEIVLLPPTDSQPISTPASCEFRILREVTSVHPTKKEPRHSSQQDLQARSKFRRCCPAPSHPSFCHSHLKFEWWLSAATTGYRVCTCCSPYISSSEVTRSRDYPMFVQPTETWQQGAASKPFLRRLRVPKSTIIFPARWNPTKTRISVSLLFSLWLVRLWLTHARRCNHRWRLICPDPRCPQHQPPEGSL